MRLLNYFRYCWLFHKCSYTPTLKEDIDVKVYHLGYFYAALDSLLEVEECKCGCKKAFITERQRLYNGKIFNLKDSDRKRYEVDFKAIIRKH